MSRIIQAESGGKLRHHLMKSLALTLRALGKKTDVDDGTKDMIAFLVICLEKISSTIDESVLAWEKRGYWVKADRFCMEWEWARKYSIELRLKLIEGEWSDVQTIVAAISTKCKSISPPTRYKDIPWNGAFLILKQNK